MSNSLSDFQSALNSLDSDMQSVAHAFELNNQHKIQMDRAVLDTPEQMKSLREMLQIEHDERLKAEAKDKKVQFWQLVISALTLLFSILFGLRVI